MLQLSDKIVIRSLRVSVKRELRLFDLIFLRRENAFTFNSCDRQNQRNTLYRESPIKYYVGHAAYDKQIVCDATFHDSTTEAAPTCKN